MQRERVLGFYEMALKGPRKPCTRTEMYSLSQDGKLWLAMLSLSLLCYEISELGHFVPSFCKDFFAPRDAVPLGIVPRLLTTPWIR